MISKENLKRICGIGIYNNIPVDEIKELRITHSRLRNYCCDVGTEEIELKSRGGFTKVDLVIDDKVFSGLAMSSLDDNFCKKTGRDLALVRVFREYWRRENIKKPPKLSSIDNEQIPNIAEVLAARDDK